MNLRAWGLLLLPAACLSLAGCGLPGASSDRVIYANYDDSDGFCAQIKDAFAAKAKADGIEVEFLDAKNDGNMQIDQLNEAIGSGAGAIILLAADGSSIVKTIEKANDAGIPVITVNRSVAGGQVLRAYSDDVEAGRMQGEYMAAHLPPNAKIVYLQGDETQSSAVGRWEGFKAACLDKRSDVQLLSFVDAGWSKAEALKTMMLWMNMFPEINGVVAGNDEMALGAIAALKGANRLSGCLVSAVDATPAGLAAVEVGEMAQTVKQDAKAQGEGALTLAEGFLKGNPPSGDLAIPFTSITADNLAQAK
ncbi:sugar ABC transporter substrate-binding protein [Selenomonas sp. oral taxon 478]|uniref:sugar ABC transporter substrate-binding protein n=1 Tax=Selenomonas sp. oral taxon 478 TaxID=712538 RepID=UPI00067A08DE|nr:sugar ABC transporter substrate-binding protein [Selenomonas sp. oral taxon 478]AKT53272.1 sugar ABC transporter substrate-binding protein [Selenomonas sp. oral taxon 478]